MKIKFGLREISMPVDAETAKDLIHNSELQSILGFSADNTVVENAHGSTLSNIDPVRPDGEYRITNKPCTKG